MRKLSSSLVVTTLLLLSACDHDTTGPAKPTNRTLSAVIDGASWSAVSITIDSLAPASIVIFGTKANETLAIAIPLDQGPGTQIIGSTTPVFAGLILGSQSWLASRTQGGAGSITLTTVTPGHIVGTFEFTMAAHEGASPTERRVSAGTFDVKY
jgi:uncharacterized protein DUF6252